MSGMSLKVGAHEGGILRVFGLDTGDTDGAALRDALLKQSDEADAKAAAALGVKTVDPWWVTVVQSADIAELGLASYLAEGHDVPRAQLSDAGDALAAAPETLLIVQSPAFGARGETLAPAPFLTPVVEFDTKRSPAPARPMPKAETAPAEHAAPDEPAAPQRPAALRRVIVLSVLAAAGLVVALAALSGG